MLENLPTPFKPVPVQLNHEDLTLQEDGDLLQKNGRLYHALKARVLEGLRGSDAKYACACSLVCLGCIEPEITDALLSGLGDKRKRIDFAAALKGNPDSRVAPALLDLVKQGGEFPYFSRPFTEALKGTGHSGVLEELRKGMDGEDAKFALECAIALQRCQSPSILGALERNLRSFSSTKRVLAAIALCEQRSRRVISTLLKGMRIDDFQEVCLGALEGVHSRKVERAVFQQFKKCWNRVEGDFEVHFARVLEGTKDPKILRKLLASWERFWDEEEDGLHQDYAALALRGVTDPKIIDELLQRLEGRAPVNEGRCAVSLTGTKDRRALDTLCRYAIEGEIHGSIHIEDYIGNLAARALRGTVDPDIIKKLVAAFLADTSVYKGGELLTALVASKIDDPEFLGTVLHVMSTEYEDREWYQRHCAAILRENITPDIVQYCVSNLGPSSGGRACAQVLRGALAKAE